MKKPLSDKNKDFKLPEQPDSLSSKDSFALPDGYFSNLQNQISTKIELISKLESQTGDSHFNVPENYFEDLSNQISQGISKPVKNNIWKKWLTILLKPQVSLAFASLLLLLWFSIKTREPKTFEIPSSNITLQDLLDSEYIQYLDEYNLIEVLATQEDIPSGESNTDTYIQYLIDNNIDISQLELSL